MSDEIELVSDGDGLAVLGEPGAVDRFLRAHGLDDAPSRDLLEATTRAGMGLGPSRPTGRSPRSRAGGSR